MKQKSSLRATAKQSRISYDNAGLPRRRKTPPRNDVLLVFLTLLFATLLPTPARAQDITTGLVGNWTLDETSGTTAADISGSGNDGTMQNGLSADSHSVSGQLNSAIHFNTSDSNDYIQASSAAINPARGTFAMWFKPDVHYSALTTQNFLLGEWGGSHGPNDYFFNLYSPTNGLYCGIDDATGTLHYSGPGGATLDPHWVVGKWMHLACTYDDSLGTNNIKVYVNGQELAYLERFGMGDWSANRWVPPANLTFGNDGSGFSRPTEGTLDDIRIYDRVLSDADITALYNYTGPTCSSPEGRPGEITYNDDDNILQYCNGSQWVAIGPTSDLTSDLIGHWELNETSGNAIADSSSNNLNGTWIDNDDNDVTGETTAGSIDDALTFDNTDDYISIPDAANAMDVAYPITISAWMYPTDFTSDGIIFASDVNGTNYHGYWLMLHDTTGYIYMGFGDGGMPGPGSRRSATGSIATNLNQWNHVVGIIRGPTDMSIYVNGVADSITYTGTGSAIAFSGSGGNIGRIFNSPAYNYFDGAIDDVRFYGRELSPFEIKSLHAMGASCVEPSSASPVGHWKLDEVGGNAIADSSGSGLNGTWTDNDDNDVTGETGAGKVDTSLTFDGTNDHVDIATSPSLDIAANGGFSQFLWFHKTTDCGTSNEIMTSRFGLNHNNRTWWFGCNASTDTLGIRVEGSSTDAITYGTTVIDDGQWHYAGWVYDGTLGEIRLYLDGVLENSVSYTLDADMDIANPFCIGGYDAQCDDAVYHFEGLLDDVRVYNKALTQLEIELLYGSTGGTCSISTCSNPLGMNREIVFDADHHVMQYCNGGQWIAMGPPSDGGAACANPVGLAGTLRYDGDNNVLMYCEGDEWMAVAGH